MAWWPGGRTMANPFCSLPVATWRATCCTAPAARVLAFHVNYVQAMYLYICRSMYTFKWTQVPPNQPKHVLSFQICVNGFLYSLVCWSASCVIVKWTICWIVSTLTNVSKKVSFTICTYWCHTIRVFRENARFDISSTSKTCMYLRRGNMFFQLGKQIKILYRDKFISTQRNKCPGSYKSERNQWTHISYLLFE